MLQHQLDECRMHTTFHKWRMTHKPIVQMRMFKIRRFTLGLKSDWYILQTYNF
jgi:hypothetical protein